MQAATSPMLRFTVEAHDLSSRLWRLILEFATGRVKDLRTAMVATLIAAHCAHVAPSAGLASPAGGVPDNKAEVQLRQVVRAVIQAGVASLPLFLAQWDEVANRQADAVTTQALVPANAEAAAGCNQGFGNSEYMQRAGMSRVRLAFGETEMVLAPIGRDRR